jgi:hypothetical protein
MFGTSCLLYAQKAQAQLTCFPSPLPRSNGSKLPSFPLHPPFDAPKRPPTHALVRLIRLPAELEPVHLERAEKYPRRQREGDLRRASGTRVRVRTRKRALQRLGTSRCGPRWSGAATSAACAERARTSIRRRPSRRCKWRWTRRHQGTTRRQRRLKRRYARITLFRMSLVGC